MPYIHVLNPVTPSLTARSASLAATAFLLFSVGKGSAQLDQTINQQLAIPPRLQWNANFGYCGETCFISAGLYYGQYCSQFTARQLASPGVPQSRANSQLLLGVNDTKAAQAMRLSVTPWKPASSSTSQDFLAWVESQILAGHPVAMGIFTNEFLFYGNPSSTAGDADYDHIVPVIGVAGPFQGTSTNVTYDPADTITFSDNGLWDPSGAPQYVFTYRFGDFQLTRKQANAKTAPIYSLKTGGTHYGIAFNGVMDINKDTVPVRVATDVNSELPALKNKAVSPPTPARINLTVTVTIPDQAATYNLYRYNSFTNVPDSKFNASAAKSSAHWRIVPQGATYVLKLPIQSSEIAVFRAVKTTAP